MADIGTGASLTFGTSSASFDLLSINPTNHSRPVVDTTHLGTTTARTNTPVDLIDTGGLECEILFDQTNTSVPVSLLGAVQETITLEFPKTNTASTNGLRWAASGCVTDMGYAIPLEDRMTQSMTVRFSGTITRTAES